MLKPYKALSVTGKTLAVVFPCGDEWFYIGGRDTSRAKYCAGIVESKSLRPFPNARHSEVTSADALDILSWCSQKIAEDMSASYRAGALMKAVTKWIENN